MGLKFLKIFKCNKIKKQKINLQVARDMSCLETLVLMLMLMLPPRFNALSGPKINIRVINKTKK